MARNQRSAELSFERASGAIFRFVSASFTVSSGSVSSSSSSSVGLLSAWLIAVEVLPPQLECASSMMMAKVLLPSVVRDSNVRTSCDWLRNERREPSRDGIGVQGGVLILCLRTYAATAYIDVPKIAAGMTLPACIGADINRISSRAAN